MTVTEQMHNEIEQLPEPLAREVLDFLITSCQTRHTARSSRGTYGQCLESG